MGGVKTQLVEALEAGRGVVSRRQHPELRTSCDWAVRKGHLSVVLPGIYALATDAALLDVRARAAMLADPAAVVCRESAATLMGWREFDEPDDLQVASLRIGRRAGFQVEERSVPRRLRRRLDGITTTSRALTALDLVPSWGGEAIDSALRRGVTLDDLRGAFALTPGRPGTVTRTALLGDSCDIPY